MEVIVAYDVDTNKRIKLKNRSDIVCKIYKPVSDKYNLYSKSLQKLIERYKDAPLVPYEMTEADIEKLKKNPDYINDIPRYIVKGYDEIVSSYSYNLNVTNEFVTRFLLADKELAAFINKNNRKVRVEIIEV